MSIRVLELGKTYAGAVSATLEGITLEVPAGKCAAILGRSGAGKSTLLRCLVGLEAFDRGAIEIDGVRLDAPREDLPPRLRDAALASLRGRTGLVFQSFELFPHLSVLDNCTLAPRKVQGLARGPAEARAQELLAQLGLGDKGRAYPEQLSGGQKQRVAIARALAMEPKVLLYDEPTSALDPALRNEVKAAFQRVAQTGMTQVVVTHDVAFAREAADLVFVLDRGKIAETGPAREVLTNPQHEATRRLVES
jgi:ABC-type polar amino acid transport system ATPase subunit